MSVPVPVAGLRPVPSGGGGSPSARRFRIGGRVQGVGFRPYVYRLARALELTGWVRNAGGEVEIHAEGPTERLERFAEALCAHAPPSAAPHVRAEHAVELEPSAAFQILSSRADERPNIRVGADLSLCEDCLAEMQDPAARRYRYPFINCTQCGPRYTVIRALPYDRANTSLADFALCADCAAEYGEPDDRRFHAEPLACAACGPSLTWQSATGAVRGNEPALAAAVAALRGGAIIAVRGVGGYHLMCDARDEHAVRRLRARKRRPAKPLALMVPWRGADGLACAREVAELSATQCRALLDVTRPIVLAKRAAGAALAPSIAPDVREVGLMLPYSPLHRLLLDDVGMVLVATSGNLSGEPVLTEPEEAARRLAAIADGFLHHDRPIVRPADDPVVREIAGAMRPVRIGRGSAPLEIELPERLPVPMLAVGAYLKNTIALGWEDRVVISPHIGELSSPRSRAVFAQVAADLQRLYGVRAACLVHDAHPDFPNTRWALEQGLPTRAVAHHVAHAAAVAGEHPSRAPLLCFTWDGMGLGADGTLWGGEALLGEPGSWRRVASLRPFRLLGGERAAREPWRVARALCWEAGEALPHHLAPGDALLRAAFEAHLNCPVTSSVGRLFDGAAALVGVCTSASYEAQAAMCLEALAGAAEAPPSQALEPAAPLPIARDHDGVWRIDWAPLVPLLLDGSRAPAVRAAEMHARLAASLVEQARRVRAEARVERVGIAGGVFQNRILCERVQALLLEEGFEVLIPKQVPLNDAGISFGQLIEAGALERSTAP